MLRLLTQSSKTIVATVLEVFFVFGIALVKIKSRFVLRTMYRLALVVFGKVPSI